MRLSASQIKLALSCPRAWVFKYKLNEEYPKSQALQIGSAFHDMLEDKEPDLSGLNEVQIASLTVMVNSYQETMGNLYPGYQSIREIQFDTENFKGFIDCILYNENKWYIVENKTAFAIVDIKKHLLTEDIQINAYYRYIDLVISCADINYGVCLDRSKFSGIIYTQTTKPRERQKKNETLSDFIDRLTCRTEVWEFTESELARSNKIFEGSVNLASSIIDFATKQFEENNDAKDVTPMKGGCMMFGKPCGYFEKCHPEYKQQGEEE